MLRSQTIDARLLNEKILTTVQPNGDYKVGILPNGERKVLDCFKDSIWQCVEMLTASYVPARWIN